jgi:hypothetical protein
VAAKTADKMNPDRIYRMASGILAASESIGGASYFDCRQVRSAVRRNEQIQA